jgi:hypothetical protein
LRRRPSNEEGGASLCQDSAGRSERCASKSSHPVCPVHRRPLRKWRVRSSRPNHGLDRPSSSRAAQALRACRKPRWLSRGTVAPTAVSGWSRGCTISLRPREHGDSTARWYGGMYRGRGTSPGHDLYELYRADSGDPPTRPVQNLISLCAPHHLRGVHMGRVRVRLVSPGLLRWELGVEGGAPRRVLVRPAPAAASASGQRTPTPSGT